MNQLRDLFAHNDNVQAAANFFGILAGLWLLYTVVKWAWHFTKTAYQTSVKTALKRYQRRADRAARESSLDLHAFVFHLANDFSSMCIIFAGMLMGGFQLYLSTIDAFKEPLGGGFSHKLVPKLYELMGMATFLGMLSLLMFQIVWLRIFVRRVGIFRARRQRRARHEAASLLMPT